MRHRLLAASAILAALAGASVAFAGDDMTSLSYISYLERYATIQPARDQEPVDAVVNLPIVTGDRLDAARGARVEVQLSDGSTLWVDEFTTIDFDAIAGSQDEAAPRSALYLVEGTVALEIPSTAIGEAATRLDSPAGMVLLNRPGFYRLEWRSGQLHIQAHSGLVELPAGIGSTLLRTGQEAWLDATGGTERASLSLSVDDFWSWVQERRRPAVGSRTAQYVDGQASSRAAALDYYGEWVYMDSFSSWMWRPHVSVNWVPYSHGRWYWTPVGWSWVSYEPWGWYPFHYGSWYWDVGIGWMWGWDRVWSPAWVHWIHTPGYVGWCPRGYYDWYYARNCTHCWGQGKHPPYRWNEVALDFSGRVRLREVDPRPWTMIPAGQFTSARLDRVRLDPSRLLRDGDGVGVVRSGPLLTPRSSRLEIERSFDTVFRESPDRGVRELGTILGRAPRTEIEGSDLASRLRPERTSDVARRAGRGSDQPGGTTVRIRPGDDSRTWRIETTAPSVPRQTVGRERVGGSSRTPVTTGTPQRSSGSEGGATVRQRVRSEPTSREATPRSQPRATEPRTTEPRTVPRREVQREAPPPAREAPQSRTVEPPASRIRERPAAGSPGGERVNYDRRSVTNQVSERPLRRLSGSTSAGGSSDARAIRSPSVSRSLRSPSSTSGEASRAAPRQRLSPSRSTQTTSRTRYDAAPSSRAPRPSLGTPRVSSPAPRATVGKVSSPVRSISPRSTSSPGSPTPRASSSGSRAVSRSPARTSSAPRSRPH